MWFHSTLVPVNDDDGQIDYIIVVSIETTERKRAEQKVTQHLAEMKFLSTTAMEFVDLQPKNDVYEVVARRLKELVGDPIVVISSSDETGREVIVRAIVGVGKRFEAALKILGRSPVGMSFPILESFLHQTASGKLVKLSEGIHHYTRKKIPRTAAKLIEKTLGLGDLYSMQFSRGGRMLAIATIIMRKGERLENPDLIETYINHASVLLQNRQAEDVLRQSEDRYRAIAEDMPTMICRFLPGCEITYVNQACCSCFGKTSEKLVGSSFLSLIPKADRETVATNISALTVESPTQSHEHRVIGPDGEIRWQSWTNRATFDNEGMVLAYQSVGEDITERKQAEENLLWYQERLRFLASELAQAEEKARHRIATDLHDGVAQDLLSLKMELEKIRKSTPSTGLHNTLAQMIETVEKMIQTTRSLMLELSPPVLYELGLEPAIEWLTEKVQIDHGIPVSFEDDGQNKPLAEGVRVGLFRAVRELLINVVKHAQASNIEITTRRDGQNIHAQVKDDGIGFDPVAIQSPSDLKSGVGLFYIRERLMHLGGVFDLESKPGQGTIATLIAPIKD